MRPIEKLGAVIFIAFMGWFAILAGITLFLPAREIPAVPVPITVVDLNKAVPAEEVFMPVAGIARQSEGDAATTDVRSLARVVHPPSYCDVAGGLPMAIVDGRPIVGREFRIGWTTRPTAPPDFPAYATVLLVSHEPVEPEPIGGAPGCWLQVSPDNIMIPRASGILTQSGGQVELRWTPQANMLGVPFYTQLLVADPRNDMLVTVAPMVELVVGNR